ncbi:MAG: hypothetical protein ACOWWH_00805, partial [Eubacteriaceae bacterium]
MSKTEIKGIIYRSLILIFIFSISLGIFGFSFIETNNFLVFNILLPYKITGFFMKKLEISE